jgi:hypothetical protein
VPQIGDEVHVDGSGELRVEATEERRVTVVRLIPARRKKPRATDDADAETADEITSDDEEEQRT